MWIVMHGKVAFNLELHSQIIVINNRLVLKSNYPDGEREFTYDSPQLAEKDFNHILNALKRKEGVIYL